MLDVLRDEGTTDGGTYGKRIYGLDPTELASNGETNATSAGEDYDLL